MKDLFQRSQAHVQMTSSMNDILLYVGIQHLMMSFLSGIVHMGKWDDIY